MLQKSPMFAFVAIASLALGLGANTAIFSMLDQALLRPLKVQNPHELMLVTSPGPNRGSFNGDNSDRLFSRPAYIDLRDHNEAFSGLIARSGALYSSLVRDLTSTTTSVSLSQPIRSISEPPLAVR